jgi:hypothetical protein
MQKLEAEKTAKRVSGVVAVANDIEVRLPIFTIKDQIPRSPATALGLPTGSSREGRAPRTDYADHFRSRHESLAHYSRTLSGGNEGRAQWPLKLRVDSKAS